MSDKMVSVLAFPAVPKFENYIVTDVYTGRVSSLQESSSGSNVWDEYRNQASHSKVNFTGHYIVFTGGCGGGAICGEVFDAKTGKIVSSLPDEYLLPQDAEDDVFDIFYKENSRLIEISGTPVSGGRDDGYRSRYYEFKNGRFICIPTEK
jgi:hypothetical protein